MRKAASTDALDAVKGKTGRICPLACEFGYRADGDRCVKITCRAGYELNDGGSCEKIRVKKAASKSDQPKLKPEPPQGTKVEAGPPKPQAAGKIFCDNQGCRPVAKGCRIEIPWLAGGRRKYNDYGRSTALSAGRLKSRYCDTSALGAARYQSQANKIFAHQPERSDGAN
jgi:hypothetical protein